MEEKISIIPLRDFINDVIGSKVFKDIIFEKDGYTAIAYNSDDVTDEHLMLMAAIGARAGNINKGKLPGPKFWNNPSIFKLFEDLSEVKTLKLKW